VSKPTAWRILSKSDNSAGLVLAVDFDTTGRVEARFADLVANLTAATEIWETIAPDGGTVSPGAAQEYLDHWAGDLQDERRPIQAVLGFCGGAIYAAALVERIRRAQGHEPLLLLFDPELSTAQTLLWQFHKVMGFMSGILSSEQVAQAQEMGRHAYDTISDVAALKEEISRLMKESGEPALINAGLDERRREELFGVFDSFLSYLAAASQIDPLDQWRRAIAFSSKSPLSGLNAMRASGLDILVGKEIGLDAEHGTLLANRDLAAQVSDLLSV